MELCLQVGHGMKDHCFNLVKLWGKGLVILSPRDNNHESLIAFSSKIKKVNGTICVDPQMYYPHTEHKKLTAHQFWPDNYETNNFTIGQGVDDVIIKLKDLNEQVKSDLFIIPMPMIEYPNETSIDSLDSYIAAAHRHISNKPLYVTIPLSANSLKDIEFVNEIIDNISSKDYVEGAYIVASHLDNDYFVSDPVWLANLGELCAGLRLGNKKVILGYANQQMLFLGMTSINYIATGTFKNVRSFNKDRFVPNEDSGGQQIVWYYCPASLGEYKIEYLDIAQTRSVLDSMAPPTKYNSSYAAPLFAGAKPTSAAFDQQASFRHYLQCMYHQVEEARTTGFVETYENNKSMFEKAYEFVKLLALKGVLTNDDRGMTQDHFLAVISAMTTVHASRQARLKRKWSMMF